MPISDLNSSRIYNRHKANRSSGADCYWPIKVLAYERLRSVLWLLAKEAHHPAQEHLLKDNFQHYYYYY